MATHTALPELQTGYYAKLAPSGVVHSSLSALGVTGIFDFGGVPQGQDFPYITIGDGIETPDNAFQLRGYDVAKDVDIWTKDYEGFDQCYLIFHAVQELLDQKALTLPTHRHVGTEYEFSQPLYDPDDNTIRRLNIRYRNYTQEQ